MTSSLYLNVIVAYVQYMYVFVSYQYVDTSSNFDIWIGIMVTSNEQVIMYE
jgi:hypothetical protein